MRVSSTTTRTGRLVGVAGAVAVVATLAFPASAAHAADVVSQGTGRLITTSLLGTNILDTVAALRGAVAVNPDASGDVTVDQPLDATALAGLLGLQAGSTNLFGNNGIIQLGAVGQYAQARDDGSSSAFSGAVSAAPSLIGVGTVTPSSVGSPLAGNTAQLKLGDPAGLVGFGAHFGTLAASAQQAADGTQTGQYVLADAGFDVNGTVVSGTLGLINPALNTLIALANTSGAGLTNPFASGTISLSLNDLLSAAGVSNVNSLPAGTDLVSYVPKAVANKITQQVQSVINSANTLAQQLKSNFLTFAAGVALEAAVATANATIVPILNGLTNSLVAPLADALTTLVQLKVNVQSNGADGSFSQTALRVGVGPNGSLAAVDLATATVGPNAGQLAVPVAGPESLGLAAGGIGTAVLAIGAVMLLRRRRTVAGTVEG
ncbi:choice-of-anchor G family protein [uncultured Microbacterium sp.]|uniref:PVV-CTERM domain-containing choice-of-anchor G protein n=1 Tax=uncultured Microbacterium sp. TaxID=191216 RepID=UPI0025EC7E3D|nr:choice-of-anchor G family protein [uncultured Microbacterium sp.]